MGNIIKNSIKKILIGIKDLFYIISLKINYWKLYFNPSVSIHNSVKLKLSTTIEVRGGGTISVGKNTELLENVLILTYGGSISIGERCSINAGTIIYGHGNTCIGNDVLIAGGCMIIPANHNYEDKILKINQQGLKLKPIIIEDNVWIGHGCSILAGVIIGTGSIIAAGTVVNKNIPPNAIVAGVPGAILKNRD
jgi:acetyltransferase-like isoleucine patch superfamily enzyme